MRQLAVPALTLALGAATALALASCGGGGDAKLLPGNTAQEITENLNRVKQYAEEGECVGAEDAAAEVNAQVETLGGVDPKLVEALRRGTSRLGEVIATCEEEPLETTESSEEGEERPRPPGQVKKEEREREAEAEEPPPKGEKGEAGEQGGHEPKPPETTPEEAPAPPSGEGGGTPSPGGVSPGTPVEPGGD